MELGNYDTAVYASDEEYREILIEMYGNEARAQRDSLLKATDWVVTKAQERGEAIATEWLTYRQALRDISQQQGFPMHIEWPNKP